MRDIHHRRKKTEGKAMSSVQASKIFVMWTLPRASTTGNNLPLWERLYILYDIIRSKTIPKPRKNKIPCVLLGGEHDNMFCRALVITI